MPLGTRGCPDYDFAAEARRQARLQEIIRDIIYGSPQEESGSDLIARIRKKYQSNGD